ncbi:MAG TPA: hypothetical protein VMV45_09195, partial [Casimicrobiaceae bacterium]|nr:hypothetical protein [Casimicrobiaceae bacterium]
MSHSPKIIIHGDRYPRAMLAALRRLLACSLCALTMSASAVWAQTGDALPRPCSANADGSCTYAAQPVAVRVHELTVEERTRIATLQREATGARTNEEKRQAAALQIAAIRNGTYARMRPDDRASADRLWHEVAVNDDAPARRSLVRQLSALFASYGFQSRPQQSVVPVPLIASPAPMSAPLSPYANIG